MHGRADVARRAAVGVPPRLGEILGRWLQFAGLTRGAGSPGRVSTPIALIFNRVGAPARARASDAVERVARRPADQRIAGGSLVAELRVPSTRPIEPMSVACAVAHRRDIRSLRFRRAGVAAATGRDQPILSYDERAVQSRHQNRRSKRRHTLVRILPYAQRGTHCDSRSSAPVWPPRLDGGAGGGGGFRFRFRISVSKTRLECPASDA